ncbi:hypothetical protein ACP6L2_00970 [Sphingobacterium lactis]|uniref:hypothetical protein n=1 Tax=Sphingobacterium lactis TaxID=797291 RepID=UPI003F80B91D
MRIKSKIFNIKQLFFYGFLLITNFCQAREQDSLENWTYISSTKFLSEISMDTIYQYGQYMIRFPNKTSFINNVIIKTEGDSHKDTIIKKLWRIEVINMSNDSIYLFNDDLVNPKLLNTSLLNVSKLVGFNIFQFRDMPIKIKESIDKLDFIKEKVYNNEKCIEVQFQSKDGTIYNIIIDPSLNTPFNTDIYFDNNNKVSGAIAMLNYITKDKGQMNTDFFYKNYIDEKNIPFFNKLLNQL